MGKRRKETEERRTEGVSSDGRAAVRTKRVRAVPGKEATGKGKLRSWFRANRRDIRFLLVFGCCMGLYYICTLTPPVKRGFFPAYLRWNAVASGAMLRLAGEELTVQDASIVSGSGPSIQVERGCDAVEPSALFVSAVLASPVPWLSRLVAAGVGTLLLMVLNLIRVASLFWFRVHHPSVFDTMHLDVWQALFIFLAILLWAIWASRESRRLAVQPNVHK